MRDMMPAPLNENILMVQDAMNNDIIQSIHKLYPTGLLQTKDYSKRFKAATNLQTAKNVWEFMKRKITYKRDPNHKQMIRLPNRFANDGDGDCKSFALFAASILGNLGLPVTFRYTGYKAGTTTPTHVYMVTQDEIGNDIIVDGVYRYFNSEKPYTFKKDYKMEVLALADDVNGIGKFKLPGGKFRKKFLKAHLKMLPKPLRKAAIKQLQFAAKVSPLPKEAKEEFNNLSGNENSFRCRKLKFNLNSKLKKRIGEFDNDLGYLGVENDATYIQGIYGKKKKKKKKGKFFKKIGKAVKKVAQAVKKVSLVPMRKSFQALIAVNFMALASKLKLALVKKPGKVEALWKKLGGNPKNLIKTINSGAKKKPIFGKRPKGVRGIGTIEIEGIGAAPVAALLASAGTILAAFASILKGIKNKDAGVDDPEAGEQLNTVIDDSVATANKDILRNTGGNSDPGSGYNTGSSSTSSGSDESNFSNQSEDSTDGIDKSKMLMIGGAAIAAILLLNNKK